MILEGIRQVQDCEITSEDVQLAIMKMKNEKTPGADGIPIDLYKVFWSQLKAPFMEMVKDCYKKEQLHESARQGILNLIPKAQKDTRFIKNLKPITLLNTDYKIIEKAIADKCSLAILLRSNKEIEGITINQIRNILNQFADDMDIFSICNQKSVEAIISELNQFYYQSGFTVSYEKTTLYRIGSLRHSNAQLYGIDQYTWSNEDINVLGVTIAHEDLIHKNYESMIGKVKALLNTWYHRGLSLMGKVQVLNTLVASLFVYKMMVLPQIPKGIVKNLENIMRDFLWNGRKAKIALSIIQNPKKGRGTKLSEFSTEGHSIKGYIASDIGK